MKTRTYIIAGTIAFLIALLITYAGFAFVLLETNPLKWTQYTRLFFLFCEIFIPILITSAAIGILCDFERLKNKP